MPQKEEKRLSVLPRFPRNLSVMIVKKKRKNNTFKDLRVRRQKMRNTLVWLLKNNPRYRGATVNHNALEALPIDGFLFDIMTVETEHDFITDDMGSPDSGPPTKNDGYKAR